MALDVEVLVVGGGAMGSATAFHLATRGVDVLVADRSSDPGVSGSSAGHSRVIRTSYHEHPDYVPLLQRSWQLWDDLNARAGRTICRRTGIVYIGPEESVTIAGAKAAAAEHDLPQETFRPDEARSRFEQFVIGDDDVVLWEDAGGYILTEEAISAHLTLARACGASVRTECLCTDLHSTGGGIEAMLDGEVVTARHAVVCTGAWTPAVLPTLNVDLCVTRQVVGWFDVGGDERFAEDSMPVWTRDDADSTCWYGFPSIGGRGVKVARHHQGTVTTARDLDRSITVEDEAELSLAAECLHLPASSSLEEVEVCMYTTSSDGHFVIDHDRSLDHVTVACGFSGHGFKMAPVIGKALADLAGRGATDLPIGFLMADRFDPIR